MRKRLFHVSPFIIFILSFLFLFLFRFPSLFEPKWYGDEGTYSAVAHHLNSGYKLYTNVWDNKPPVIYLLYSIFDRFGENVQLVARVASLFFSALSSFVLFFIVRNITKKPHIAFISGAILNVFLALPVFEANIANTEHLFILFILLGLYFLFKNKARFWLLSGFFFSLSVFTKISTIIEIFGFFLIILIDLIKDKNLLKKSIKKGFILSLGFLIPTLLITSYFIFNNNFSDFIYTVFTFGFSYIKNNNNAWLIPNFLKNTLLTRGIIFLIVIGIVTELRLENKISRVRYFTLVWFATSSLAVLLSNRPYPHYALEVLPSFSFLTPTLFFTSSRIRKLAIFLCCIWLLYKIFTGWQPLVHNNPRNYYRLFLDKVNGKITKVEYNNAFNWRVEKAYKIRDILNDKYSGIKSVFIYDEFPWLYKIANIYSPIRFMTSHHFFWQEWHRNNFMDDIQKFPPELIIIKSDVNLDSEFNNFLIKHYIMDGEYVGYSFFKKLNFVN